MAILRELASIVKNDIQAGLKGVGNYSFSIEQIERELELARAALLKRSSLQNILKPSEFSQDINCIPLACEDLSECCEGVDTGKKGLQFKIPRPAEIFGQNSISYVGQVDRTKRYMVYTDYSFLAEAYRVSPNGKPRPFVFINLGRVDEDDMVTGYIFNVPRLKLVRVTGVFENPYLAYGPEGIEDARMNMRLPIPEWAAEEIVRSLVNKYVQYYKAFNQPPLPNTQTSQGTA